MKCRVSSSRHGKPSGTACFSHHVPKTPRTLIARAFQTALAFFNILFCLGEKIYMQTKKKYNLADMLAEIEDDIHEQAKDLSQQKDIPQEIITGLMLENLKQKKQARPPGPHDETSGHQ